MIHNLHNYCRSKLKNLYNVVKVKSWERTWVTGSLLRIADRNAKDIKRFARTFASKSLNRLYDSEIRKFKEHLHLKIQLDEKFNVKNINIIGNQSNPKQ